MKKFVGFLFSGTFMGMLLIVFAVAMGYATIIESDFSSATARLIVYNTRWFEVLMTLMVINFTGMIFTKKLYREGKRNIMFMHIAWIIIILGAAITRYFGFEGNMHIRDGQTSNLILSGDSYFTAAVSHGEKTVYINKKLILAPVDKTLFDKEVSVDGKSVGLSVLRYVPNASVTLQQSPDGQPIADVITAGPSGRQDIVISDNETSRANQLLFSLNDSTSENSLKIKQDNNSLYLNSPFPIVEIDMTKGDTTFLDSGKYIPVQVMKLYEVKQTMFVIRRFVNKGVIQYEPAGNGNPNGKNITYVEIRAEGQKRELALEIQKTREISIGDLNVKINVGPQVRKLPFSLTLVNFQLDRYPGSNSPSSFLSNIILNDTVNHVHKPVKIFMNNVLKYKGFRFYQSSYDNDEKGTILSVNHDRFGTAVTYTGYFLLFYTLLAMFFIKNTRFSRLTRLINDVHIERKKLLTVLVPLLILFFVTGRATAQRANDHYIIDKGQAAKFGKLLTQSSDGRIIPVNTVANNILIKIYKKSTYKGLSANQVFMGMGIFTDDWKQVPIIKVTDEKIKSKLGISGDYASYNDFYNNKDNYKLAAEVNSIYRKPPATRNAYEKDVMAVDERVNVCTMAYSGEMLHIYPYPNSPNNQWIGPILSGTHLKFIDSIYVRGDFVKYVRAIHDAVRTHDYTKADKILATIEEIQHEYGGDIMPSGFKVNLEILYNNINIFKNLFPVYMTLGMILLGIFFLQLFRPAVELRLLNKILYYILLALFTIHTAGLVMRWIIAEHAPWSNGYESMIYIAWAIVLSGIIFRNKSFITLAITSILAGITLLTAHMSWLNPEITNLVPVLKSYWLTLHVAVITASYGFLALGSMLGFLNMILMILRSRKNLKRITLTIDETGYIIEMTLTAGLILLTIGTFLGGIWANESWGRYWGWDPKETWSLITIIIYSFILHMSLIPSLKTKFTLNFFATLGFSSVLMTYFGVNYFLSGLHSYAQGEATKVPSGVYYALGVLFIVSIIAAISEYRFSEKSTEKNTTGHQLS